MIRSVFMIFVLSILSGCSSTPTQTEVFDWNALSPPRGELLGKEVINDDDVGGIVISNNHMTIRSVGVVDQITNDTYKNITAGLEFEYAKIKLKPSYSVSSTKQIDSSNLKIKEISNFDKVAPVGRYFYYQCIVAGSYDIVITDKSGGIINLDVTEIAKKYGVDAASININSTENEPNKKEIHIKNPNVCLAFKKAVFKENIVKKYSKLWKTSSKKKESYILNEGEVSHWASPRFLMREPDNEPEFRLQAIFIQGHAQLRVCRQARNTIGDSGNKYHCYDTLKDDDYGNWNRQYYLETFNAGNQIYRTIYLQINAKRQNNTIIIKSAKLVSPEYELIVN